jgi:hypothetical protein
LLSSIIAAGGSEKRGLSGRKGSGPEKEAEESCMTTECDQYCQTLIELFFRLPDMPLRVSRADLCLARQLWTRQIPLRVVETAFLLACARRAARPAAAVPLGPIRSLYYFVPVIEELLANPVPKTYVDYLRRHVVLKENQRNTSSRQQPVVAWGGTRDKR